MNCVCERSRERNLEREREREWGHFDIEGKVSCSKEEDGPWDIEAPT